MNEMKYMVSILLGGEWEPYAMFKGISDAEHYALEKGLPDHWPDKLVRLDANGFTLYYKGGREVAAPEEW